MTAASASNGIRVGLVGFGYWGPKLARCLVESGARMTAVADVQPDRLSAAAAQFGPLATTTGVSDLLADPAVDAVAIATPASTHFELAIAALRAGKHVLVEKPLTTSSRDAARLTDEADRRGLALMVDHTFLHAPAVRKVCALVAAGRIGEPLRYDALRMGRGPREPDVDVLWDLAAHDLAILNSLFGPPRALSASRLPSSAESRVCAADLTLFFASPLTARVRVSWLSSEKIRRAVIEGSRGTILYDDVKALGKVTVRERRADAKAAAVAGGGVQTRSEDARVWIPALDAAEPLRRVATHFLHCVATGERPETDGLAGLRVVEQLEVAQRSLAGGGVRLRL